jgi:ABC-type maltose transport system permease subunit
MMVRVNRYETALLVTFLPFYLVAFGLYHFMVLAVNNRLSASDKIPHSLFWRGWSRVRSDYKRFYPNSFVYQLSVVCAVTVAAIAVAFLALRVWEYTHGRLP